MIHLTYVLSYGVIFKIFIYGNTYWPLSDTASLRVVCLIWWFVVWEMFWFIVNSYAFKLYHIGVSMGLYLPECVYLPKPVCRAVCLLLNKCLYWCTHTKVWGRMSSALWTAPAVQPAPICECRQQILLRLSCLPNDFCFTALLDCVHQNGRLLKCQGTLNCCYLGQRPFQSTCVLGVA